MLKETSSTPRPDWGHLLFYTLFLAGIAVSIFFAGGADEGGEGIFLLLVGCGLLVCAPKVQVEGKIWLACGLFLLFCSLSLLPGHFLASQDWRKHFSDFPEVLGGVVTPIPRESLFWLGIASISTMVFLFCLSRPLRSGTLLGVATAGCVVCLAYAGLAVFALKCDWKLPYHTEASFGFFPSRNHTATLLMSGCLLALGVLGVAKNRRHWLCASLAGVALAVCGSALLVFSGSRGGVVFLLLGILLWLLGLGRDRWSKPLVISFVCILLAAVALFAVSKSEARNRLFKPFASVENTIAVKADAPVKTQAIDRETTVDGRIPIFLDTWRMIWDAPLTGVGLGAYRYVYPQYRTVSLSDTTSHHPESDWLMLAAEAGLPAVIAVVGGLFILFRQARSQRDHAYWPLRWGVQCAVLAGMAHGLVDVPAHRLEIGWWYLLWAGAGLQISPTQEKKVRVWQRLTFRGTGILALILGGWMILAQWFGIKSTPFFADRKSQMEIVKLFQQDRLEEASELATKAIGESPMSHLLYAQKGVILLNFADTEKEADRYFAIERALNPDWVQVPVNQGTAWLGIDPARTLPLWQDALERSRKIDLARLYTGKKRLITFENLLSLSLKHPELLRGLYQSAQKEVGLILLWLRSVPSELFAEEIPKISDDASFLAKFTQAERKHFLQIWYDKGDRQSLLEFAERHPDWQDASWPIRIRNLVDTKNFEEAVKNAAAKYQIELTLAPPGTAKRLSYESDIEDPIKNFAYFWKAGNEVTARRIVSEAAEKATKANKRFPEIWKISAQLAARDGNWEMAWRDLRQYLSESGLDSSF